MSRRENAFDIDLVRLSLYLLKRCWLVAICGIIGFGFMYWRGALNRVKTYTASGTMYVYNANPNLVNYGYTNTSDLTSAVKLLDTYMVVVKSNKVLDVVAEKLSADYPGIAPAYIAGTLSMGSVSDTGVLRINCRTTDPEQSKDICNAVMDVAPAEIIRVVSAGGIEIIDYATAPLEPDDFSPLRLSLLGAVGGAVVAGALLTLLFLLDHKVQDTKELKEQYRLPVLSSIKRYKQNDKDPGAFLLNEHSPLDLIEAYAKLRMNLLYTLVGKEKHSIVITSSISGEGKSTIAASLAISTALSGKRVLLVDADMRRSCQCDIFHYSNKCSGLSEALLGNCDWHKSLLDSIQPTLKILPAGQCPHNPTELLDSPEMHSLLPKLEAEYDIVLLDAPPINIVTDALALASQVAGGLFVVRQNFSDHREIRKSLVQSEMVGLNLLGFVFYGEKLDDRGSKRYYNSYYHAYDPRKAHEGTHTEREDNSRSKEDHGKNA